MLRSRKSHLLHFFFICLHRVKDDGSNLSELLNELGHKFIKQPEHVMGDQYLAIHIRAGTDADNRNLNRL